MTGEKLKEFIRRLEAEGYKSFAMRISIIRDEVEEYRTAFLAAAQSAEYSNGNSKLDTRTLLTFNSHELAGRQAPNGTADFVIRSGLIDGFQTEAAILI